MSDRVKRRNSRCEQMFSALPPRADIAHCSRHVCFVPKAVDRKFPFKPDPDRFGASPHPGELTSALSRRGHLAASDTQSVSDRSRSRSTSLYDSPSTAHLNGLPAPAMRGVHASVNHIATAVVSVVVVIVVVRVVAVAESEAVAPEVAIVKSTAVKFATTKSTSVETTAIMESASHAATMESTGNAAAMETASPEAAPMETATAAAVKTATAAHAASVAASTAT